MSEKQLKVWQHFFVFTEFQPVKTKKEAKQDPWSWWPTRVCLTWWKAFPETRCWVWLVGSLFVCNYNHESVHQKIQLSIQKKIQ